MKGIVSVSTLSCVALFLSCSRETPLEIRNRLDGYLITEIYITRAGSAESGPDLLLDSLAPGASDTFAFPAGSYDILAVDDEGGRYACRAFPLSGESMTLSVLPDALDEATRAVRAEAAEAACRADMRCLAVAEAMMTAAGGRPGTQAEMVEAGFLPGDDAFRCPSDPSGSGYAISTVGDSSYTVACPVSELTGHGSITDGVASWDAGE
jgi:hypothetical protein